MLINLMILILQSKCICQMIISILCVKWSLFLLRTLIFTWDILLIKHFVAEDIWLAARVKLCSGYSASANP